MGIWLEEQMRFPPGGTISTVMQKNPLIFPGVGGYTVSEVAVMAGNCAGYTLWNFADLCSGFSPYEMARAVLFCLSRFARLCEAIWTYTHRSETELE